SSEAGEGLTRLIFRLNNNAVRICYSSISADTKQAGYLPLKLLTDFSFYGYSVEDKTKLNFAAVVNSRISAIPLLRANQRAMGQDSYFDLAKHKLVKKNGEEVVFTDVKKKAVTAMAHLA